MAGWPRGSRGRGLGPEELRLVRACLQVLDGLRSISFYYNQIL
jgi:hypothetical protein